MLLSILQQHSCHKLQAGLSGIFGAGWAIPVFNSDSSVRVTSFCSLCELAPEPAPSVERTSSELSYVQGQIVHDGLGLSSTKTVNTEEKPFVEIDELKQLPGCRDSFGV